VIIPNYLIVNIKTILGVILSWKKFKSCLENKKVNHSRAREAIYKIFLDNINQFMSVNDIQNHLPDSYLKNVSLNTIYRQLSLFVSCDLLLLIQDDNKKSYYIVVDEEVPIFHLCPKCQSINFFEATDEQKELLSQMLQTQYRQNKTPFIVMHKICHKCEPKLYLDTSSNPTTG